MFRLTVSILAIVLPLVFWQYRRLAGRKKMAELDRGERCISCEGSHVEHKADVVQCLDCGYRASLSKLRTAQISEAEIDELTKPETDRRIL